jgi:ferredoxin
MTILYFTGTGNSLYAAKRIAEGNADAVIVSIGEFRTGTFSLPVDETVVLVCPVYFYGMPPVVADFLAKLELPRPGYLSCVFTAEFPNGKAVTQFREICGRKGWKLNSAFYLKMPTNYLIKSRMPDTREIESTLDQAEKKLAKIRALINGRKNFLERDSFLYSIIVSSEKAQRYWEETYPRFDLKFRADERCNACGICAKNCPTGNIRIAERPQWNAACAACLRCINICPRTAIQYGDSTEGKRRYLNPRVDFGRRP